MHLRRYDAYVFLLRPSSGSPSEYCERPARGTRRRLRLVPMGRETPIQFQPSNTICRKRLYDNRVVPRKTQRNPACRSLLLDFSGEVIRLAIENGFPKYFGAITRRSHEFDPEFAFWSGTEDFADLTMQPRRHHVGTSTSGSYGGDSGAKRTALGTNSVWAIERSRTEQRIWSEILQRCCPDSGYTPYAKSVDVRNID